MMVDEFAITLHLPDEAATAALGVTLARIIAVGDCIALSGEIGAGKTTLARALIRGLAGTAIEVPSPTFTLVQDYPQLSPPVVHSDFYRLRGADDVDELGLDEALARAALVVEWPDRASETLPPERLRLALSIVATGRLAELTGPSRWGDRLKVAGIDPEETPGLSGPKSRS